MKRIALVLAFPYILVVSSTAPKSYALEQDGVEVANCKKYRGDFLDICNSTLETVFNAATRAYRQGKADGNFK